VSPSGSATYRLRLCSLVVFGGSQRAPNRIEKQPAESPRRGVKADEFVTWLRKSHRSHSWWTADIVLASSTVSSTGLLTSASMGRPLRHVELSPAGIN
jgi:hypothetical protein